MQKGNALIYIVIAVVAILAIGGFIYSKKSHTQIKTPVNSQTTTKDKTDKWKTFTYERSLLSFQYPPSYKVTVSDNGPEPRIDIDFGTQTSLVIYIDKPPADFSVVDAIKEENIKVGNKEIPFMYYKSTVTNQLSAHSDLDLPQNTWNIYAINFYLDTSNQNQDLTTVKQILSTLRFAESKDELDILNKADSYLNDKDNHLGLIYASVGGIEIVGEWAAIFVVGRNRETNKIVPGGIGIMIAHKVGSDWFVERSGDPNYRSWIDQLPKNLLPKDKFPREMLY